MSEQYLILHKVRGEPAFDIAERCRIGTGTQDNPDCYEEIWIVSTSGHRAYPFKHWLLDDLMDVSDINYHGHHPRPLDKLDTVPADWPDHYEVRVAPAEPKSTGRKAIDFLRRAGVLPQETERRA